MKESLKAQDKRIVFRETFTDEATVRANGGTPNLVTFSEGVATISSVAASKINYKSPSTGVYSVRIRLSNVVIATSYLFDVSDGSTIGAGYMHINTGTGIISKSSGTTYVNGIASSTATTSSTEIVVTGITLTSTLGVLTIGNRYSNNYPLNCKVELFEIYQGTLTANEVLNLYQNKQNEELQNSKTQYSSGTELIVNANDRTFESGTTGNWTGSFKSSSFTASTEQKKSGSYSMKYVSDGTGVGEVRLSNTANNLIAANSEGGYATAWVYSSIAGVTMSARGLGNTVYVSSASTAINTWQQLTLFIPDGVYATTSYILWFSTPNNVTVYIDDVSWVKLTNNTYNEILRVDARNGVISNKYSGSISGELVTNGDFATDSIWAKGTGWSILNGVATKVAGTASSLSQNITAASKIYAVVYTIKNYTAGSVRAQLSGGGGGAGATRTANGTYIENITAGTAAPGSFYFVADATFAGDIDDVSVKEIIPSVTNTATTVVRDGNVWAMNFNSSTSKVDCGSYNTLVGDKTFVAWVNPRSFGESGYGRLFDNGNFILSLYTTGNRVGVSSNGYTTTALSASNSIILGNKYLIAVTRTSTGIVNIYINGVLSGTANQASGTPAAGTTNIIVGNNNAASYTFDGLQSNNRIVNGILTAQEITQIYQSEKALYNL